MEVGSKLPYEELQFKFDFCHGLRTFHELLPFVQNSFSRLLLAMLSYIWMEICSNLWYEELQIKFDVYHKWSTFCVACEA